MVCSNNTFRLCVKLNLATKKEQNCWTAELSGFVASALIRIDKSLLTWASAVFQRVMRRDFRVAFRGTLYVSLWKAWQAKALQHLIVVSQVTGLVSINEGQVPPDTLLCQPLHTFIGRADFDVHLQQTLRLGARQ